MEELTEENLVDVSKGFVDTFSCSELASTLKVPLRVVDQAGQASAQPAKVALEVLKKWKQASQEATRGALHAALLKIERRDLANCLEPTVSACAAGPSLSTSSPSPLLPPTSSSPPLPSRPHLSPRSSATITTAAAATSNVATAAEKRPGR